MRINILIFVLASTLLVSSCGPRIEYLKKTASGYAEGFFPNKSLDELQSQLASLCNQGGLAIEDISTNKVVCSKPLGNEPAEAVWRAIAIPSYATDPIRRLQFVMFRTSGGVQVTTQEWIEYQNAYGQTTKSPLNFPKQVNSIQGWLWHFGAVR